MKSWLLNNTTEIYSTHNEGKSVVAEGFIKTLKNKIYKRMTAVGREPDYKISKLFMLSQKRNFKTL